MPGATAVLYRAELRRLDDALVAYRHAELASGRGVPRQQQQRRSGPMRVRPAHPGRRVGAQRGPDHVRALCGGDFEPGEL